MGQFLKNFDQYQITPINSEAGHSFDPYKHEAVEMLEDSEWEPNIVRTIQTGYESKGKLIQAARVVVAKASRPDTKMVMPNNADDLSEAGEEQEPQDQDLNEDMNINESVPLNNDFENRNETIQAIKFAHRRCNGRRQRVISISSSPNPLSSC